MTCEDLTVIVRLNPSFLIIPSIVISQINRVAIGRTLAVYFQALSSGVHWCLPIIAAAYAFHLELLVGANQIAPLISNRIPFIAKHFRYIEPLMTSTRMMKKLLSGGLGLYDRIQKIEKVGFG